MYNFPSTSMCVQIFNRNYCNYRNRTDLVDFLPGIVLLFHLTWFTLFLRTLTKICWGDPILWCIWYNYSEGKLQTTFIICHLARQWRGADIDAL